MRRLAPAEETALLFLAERVPYSPGIWMDSQTKDICDILDGLVKAKRVHREDTEDGPVYTLRARGQWEAEALLKERV